MRVLVTTFVFPLLLAAQHGQIAGDASAPHDPAAVAAGAKLYATSCGGCHGPDGTGARGPNLFHRLESHSMKDDELFGTIRNGVPGTDMPPTKLSDDDTWKLTAFLSALTGPASEATVPGDAAAGEAIFRGSKGGCSECHAILGRGNKMGPDLSNIGGSRPIGLIREALVPPKNDPSRNYALAGKEGITVTMKNGTVIKGIARNRSNYSLQVVDTNGDLHLIRMPEVKELKLAEGSIMPQDYSTRLSAGELTDLLAYLARQSVR